MKRNLYSNLIDWKSSSKRKPLLLMGARQVGKTYLLKKFAVQKYKNLIYCNFEKDKNLKSLFVEQDINPERLISLLEIYFKTKIIAGEVLIFFDEVQECPEALNSLKYFYEDIPEFHICAAGSLLGVKLSNQGFPVGKVHFLHLNPLSFYEFLLAISDASLLEYIDKLKFSTSIPDLFHKKLLEKYRLYLYIGGMPEAINSYIETQDLQEVRIIQQAILQAYNLDFGKHAPKNQIMKISQIWESIPNQLAKENNKKFVYSVVKTGARAREYEDAIQWLVDAGLILKVYNISKPEAPLSAYKQREYFKLYLLDVGLLSAMTDLEPKLILDEQQIFAEFKGAYIENYVAQTISLTKLDQLYYWSAGSGKAEIDFILQHQQKIIPLEVKSGKTKHKKSLNIYIEKYKPKLSLRTSPLGLELNNAFGNIPLYLLESMERLISGIS